MASSSEAMSIILSNAGCRYIPTRVCSVFTTRIRRCFGSPTYVNIWLGSVVSAVANLIDGVGFDLRSISLSIRKEIRSVRVRSTGLPNSSKLIDTRLGIGFEYNISLLGRRALRSNL